MTDIQLTDAISVIVDLIIPAEAPVTTTPETVKTTPCFWADRTNVRFNPRKGFEQALAAVLFGDCPRDAAGIVTELLSSGVYHRVAPQAATLRPHRPVNFLLKTWLAAGLIKSSPIA